MRQSEAAHLRATISEEGKRENQTSLGQQQRSAGPGCATAIEQQYRILYDFEREREREEELCVRAQQLLLLLRRRVKNLRRSLY